MLKLMFLEMKNRVRVSYRADLVFKKKLSLTLVFVMICAMKVIIPSFIMWVSNVDFKRSELT